MRIILITHWCCSHCWVVLTPSKELFSFSPHQWGGLGWTIWEGIQPGQLTNWPKEYSHTSWHHAEKKLGRGSGLLLGDWVGINQQVVSNYNNHHLFVYPSSVVTILPSFSGPIHCLYLNPGVLPSFQFSSPSHWCGGKVSEQLDGV